MATTSSRTQIIIPRDLRDEIENQRRITGESLAQYLRKAAAERIKRERKKKQDLKRLAEVVVGSAAGLRSKVEVEKWIKEIRRDRKLEDKHSLKRINEARKR